MKLKCLGNLTLNDFYQHYNKGSARLYWMSENQYMLEWDHPSIGPIEAVIERKVVNGISLSRVVVCRSGYKQMTDAELAIISKCGPAIFTVYYNGHFNWLGVEPPKPPSVFEKIRGGK